MIRSVGYDSKSRILEVEFNSGTIYQYFDVSKKEYEGLMKAKSHGQYFLQNIREIYHYRQTLYFRFNFVLPNLKSKKYL